MVQGGHQGGSRWPTRMSRDQGGHLGDQGVKGDVLGVPGGVNEDVMWSWGVFRGAQRVKKDV